MSAATATKITRTTIPAQRGKLDQAQHFPLWKITQAARLYPEQIRARDEAILRFKKNQYENEVDKMTDEATIQQGNAIIAAQTIDQGLGKDEAEQKQALIRLIKAGYAAEPQNLTDSEVVAVAAYAHHLKLDPMPASGDIYVIDVGGKRRIHIGYQGRLKLAQMVKKFTHRQRLMTKKECKDFIPHFKEGDAGAVVEIFEESAMKQVAQLIEWGIDADYQDFAIRSYGWWQQEVHYRDKHGNDKTRNDNPIPVGWSAYDVAAKRALVKGLRLMGVSVPHMKTAEVQTTVDADGELQITAPVEPEPDATPEDDAIEGEITEVKPADQQPAPMGDDLLKAFPKDDAAKSAPKSEGKAKKQPSLSDAPPPDDKPAKGAK